jgi:hypothetical protein
MRTVELVFLYGLQSGAPRQRAGMAVVVDEDPAVLSAIGPLELQVVTRVSRTRRFPEPADVGHQSDIVTLLSSESTCTTTAEPSADGGVRPTHR